MSRFESFAVRCWRGVNDGRITWDDVMGYMIACAAVLDYPESGDARTLFDIAERRQYNINIVSPVYDNHETAH